MPHIKPMTVPFDGWVEFDAEHWEKTTRMPEVLVLRPDGHIDWEPCSEEDITRALESLEEAA